MAGDSTDISRALEAVKIMAETLRARPTGSRDNVLILLSDGTLQLFIVWSQAAENVVFSSQLKMLYFPFFHKRFKIFQSDLNQGLAIWNMFHLPTEQAVCDFLVLAHQKICPSWYIVKISNSYEREHYHFSIFDV